MQVNSESQNPQIMLIEDDRDIRELVTEFLQMEGYTLQAFANGKEALSTLIEGVRPQLILLDWRMPIMSGKEFLKEFEKLLPLTPAIPIYLFSAETDHRLLEETISTGILKKPLDFGALLSVLSSHLSL